MCLEEYIVNKHYSTLPITSTIVLSNYRSNQASPHRLRAAEYKSPRQVKELAGKPLSLSGRPEQNR